MAITTYGELQTAIGNWLNRSDLTARIPEFISLCEDEIRRRVEVEFEVKDEMTLQNEVETLPADLRELLSLYFDDGVRQGPIEITSPERAAELQGLSGGVSLTTGIPRYASVVQNGTALELSPTPDQAYVVKRIYNSYLPRLNASTQTTNWVLQDHRDVYLYGSLIHAEPFLKNDPRVATWLNFFEKGLTQLRSFIERRKSSGSTLVMRPRRALP